MTDTFDMRPIKGLRGRVLTLLGKLCERLSEQLEEWSRHLIRCPDCGQSRYYGEGCNPRWLEITRRGL